MENKPGYVDGIPSTWLLAWRLFSNCEEAVIAWNNHWTSCPVCGESIGGDGEVHHKFLFKERYH